MYLFVAVHLLWLNMLHLVLYCIILVSMRTHTWFWT